MKERSACKLAEILLGHALAVMSHRKECNKIIGVSNYCSKSGHKEINTSLRFRGINGEGGLFTSLK